jgi:hypothetical protein
MVRVTNVSGTPVSVQDNRRRSFVLRPKDSRWIDINQDTMARMSGLIAQGLVRIDAAFGGATPTQRGPLLIEKIFVTAGFGDFLALDSLLRTDEKATVKEVYFASPAPARKLIEQVLPFCFPNLVKVETVFDDFDCQNPSSPLFCFVSLADAIRKRPEVASKLPKDIYDISIFVFEKNVVHDGGRRYEGSSLLKSAVADISRFKLPDEYLVIHPFSQARYVDPHRDVTLAEWDAIMAYLDRHGLNAVVINEGDPMRYPPSPRVTDLTNQTSILESIEITKGGKGFIGCASFVSVLAAKLFDEQDVFIKGAPYLIHNAVLYFCPLIGSQYIHSSLMDIGGK